MSVSSDNPWTEETVSLPAPVSEVTLPEGLEGSDYDPWATFETASHAASRPVNDSAFDEFDPYSPRRASLEQTLQPGKASPSVAESSPALDLPGLGHSSNDLRETQAESSKPPLLSTLGSLFKRPLPGTTTPTPETNRRNSGIMQAFAGSGASTPRPRSPPAPRVPEKEKQEELPFDFNRFLEQMRDRRADPIARYLRSFLKEFAKRQWKVQDQIRVINDFLDFISTKMRFNEVWLDTSDHDFDNAVEGMEKLVMNRVYERTFTPALMDASRLNNPTDDLERDHVLQQRIGLLSWIREEHMDLAEPTEERNRFLGFAQSELRKINQYKAPRDKLITILNCCKVIYGLMRHGSNGKEEGADLFMPYLILVVLRTNPEHLVSNIQYIQRFRNPERLQGEAGYYLSSLNGAISFIETLDRSALSNITQDEFEHQMEQAVANVEDVSRASMPATPPAPLPPVPDAAAAQPVQGGFFDAPFEALRGAFSDLVLSNSEQSSHPPQVVAGVPVSSMTPAPKWRKRGYTASVYSRSTDSLSLPTSPVSPQQPVVAEPTQEEIDARNKQQANLSTLAAMFPSAEPSVLEIVLLSHQGNMEQSIDSLLEMT